VVTEEKQTFIDAWDKHIEGTIRQQRLSRFSSVADADFCETFRNGILAHKTLTKKEKLEINAYTELWSERAADDKTSIKGRMPGMPMLRK
jgi:hypothetical protein